jgi:hypothetical protein
VHRPAAISTGAVIGGQLRVKAGKARSEAIFSELLQIADIVERAGGRCDTNHHNLSATNVT